jgi:hypothetical protein
MDVSCENEESSFSEEKEAKRLLLFSLVFPDIASHQKNKSLLVLFFRKEHSSYL